MSPQDRSYFDALGNRIISAITQSEKRIITAMKTEANLTNATVEQVDDELTQLEQTDAQETTDILKAFQDFGSRLQNEAPNLAPEFNRIAALVAKTQQTDASVVAGDPNTAATSIVISGPTTLPLGSAPAQYSASVQDSQGVALSPQPAVTWSNTNTAAGSIDPTTGLYTPATTGGGADSIGAALGALQANPYPISVS